MSGEAAGLRELVAKLKVRGDVARSMSFQTDFFALALPAQEATRGLAAEVEEAARALEALIDVAEAAKGAVILEHDPTTDGATNAEMARRALVLREALSHLEAVTGGPAPREASEE